MKNKNKPPEKPPSEKNGYLKQYLKYSTIGFQMVVTIAGGALLGDWLDDKYGNENALFTIIFSLAAIALALYLALKDLLKQSGD